MQPTRWPQLIGLTGEACAAKIKQFLIDPEHLAKMEEASRNLARPEAARETVQACLHRVEAGSSLQHGKIHWLFGSLAISFIVDPLFSYILRTGLSNIEPV